MGGIATLMLPIFDFFVDVWIKLDLFSSKELRVHRDADLESPRVHHVKLHATEKGVCLRVTRLCCTRIWINLPFLI